MKTSTLQPLLAGAGIDPASQFALSNFDKLPDSAFIRLPVLAGLGLGSPATIWRKVKEQRLPAPVKLSKQCAAWQVGVIRRHIAELVEKGGAQ